MLRANATLLLLQAQSARANLPKNNNPKPRRRSARRDDRASNCAIATSSRTRIPLTGISLAGISVAGIALTRIFLTNSMRIVSAERV
jgi:hypothetical protein